jgi:small subunit ribosomal protein S23
MKHLRETKPRPQEIVYPEDRVRRQFFKDFPFEALRPTSLVEGQDLRPEGATGREWISLAQRGAYPTVER